MADFIDKLWGERSGTTDGPATGVPGSSHHWAPLPGDGANEGESVSAGDELERLVDTRRSLHGVAEMLMAGPQDRESGTIRLEVTPTGFRTIAAPEIRLDGPDLLIGHHRVELKGTFTHLADAHGLVAAAPFEVYDEGPDSDPRRTIGIDEPSRELIIEAFVTGDAALRAFAPDQRPVLWPEHFDVSVTVDDLTYGVSAGDDEIPVPYAYVVPPRKLTGEFWAYSFGAAVRVPRSGDAGADVAAVVDFFTAGKTRAATDTLL